MRSLATAALAFLTLALAACDDGSDGAARAQQPAAAPPSVTVATPLVRKLTEWDEFTGRYEPVQQVEIHARVAGYLQEIGFKDGDTVEAGPGSVRHRPASLRGDRRSGAGPGRAGRRRSSGWPSWSRAARSSS